MKQLVWRLGFALFCASCLMLDNPAGRADSTPVFPPTIGAATLTFVSGSSVKMEQIVGDYDYALWKNGAGIKKPTASLTQTRYGVDGTDTFYSFENDGKLIFLFGDTIGADTNYQAHDAMAWSTSTTPRAPLVIHCFQNPNGTPFLVEPPGVDMGAFNIPNCGIEVRGKTYIVCSTGADRSLKASGGNPQQNEYSVLTRLNMQTMTFETGRTISQAPNGHFVIVSIHKAAGSSPDLYMFGTGLFRQSNIYLAVIPKVDFWTGAKPNSGESATQYFTGLNGSDPTYSSSEADAAPVVVDNPQGLNPAPQPTIGNLCVAYCRQLGLWLMTYDGGRQTKATNGIYFTYAAQPWGPWSKPQLIFNPVRDHAFGVFIHNPNARPPDHIAGPMIGADNPRTTPGGDYAPEMIERFTRVNGNTLTIYYALSTWNPYTVVRMKSSFTISRALLFQTHPMIPTTERAVPVQ